MLFTLLLHKSCTVLIMLNKIQFNSILKETGKPVGESIYNQKPHNPTIDTKVFLTNFGRNCRVK